MSEETQELENNQTDTVTAEEDQVSQEARVKKNIFKTLLMKQHRAKLIGTGLFVTACAATAVYITVMLNQPEENYTLVDPNDMVEDKASAEVSTVGSGFESEVYKKTVQEYNDEILQQKQKENPSAHPIPLFTDDVECADDDTQCMRDKELIGQVDCAPADHICQEAIITAMQPEASKVEIEEVTTVTCAEDDVSCIVPAAKSIGCETDDSTCFRQAGVIEVNACLITDTGCHIKQINTEKQTPACEENDNGCLYAEANINNCQLDDTACMLTRGIIQKGQCAPKDTECLEGLKGLVGYTPDRKPKLTTLNEFANSQHQEADKDQLHTDITIQSKQPQARQFDANFVKAVQSIIDLENRRIPKAHGVTNRFDAQQVAHNQAATVSQEAPAASVTQATETQRNQLIKAGTQMLGVSDLALSTDYMGPVSLTLIGEGVFRDAKVFGTMVNLEDKVRLELDRMILGDGRELSINAIALDMTTTYAAVASNVDHHRMYRYGWWGFGTLLKAVGDVTRLGAEQTSKTDDTTVTSATLNTNQEIKIALGTLGAGIGEIFQDRINRPITVHVDVNEQMGIWFIDSVYDNER